MAYSYNWLKTYFDEALPSTNEIENGIIFHSFEVEGLEEKNGDTLLDIKILPDRAHDCLCHTGIAGEITAIFNLPKRPYSTDYGELKLNFSNAQPTRQLEVKIDCPDLCRRYIGRMIENVTVGASPDWLKTRLENIGQRSISNIVDATNYVMFDVGQPLHAFDADKVVGNITVRRAKPGEKITTLDGKELTLNAENMVIADDQGPLALAGIKGGNRAEVDQKTKNIILESANFDPVSVRRTSAAVGVRTDASKRFENNLSAEVAGDAMDRLTSLIFDIAGQDQLKIGERVDVYPGKSEPRTIATTINYINNLLGIIVPETGIISILERLDIKVEKEADTLKLSIPYRRVDLEAPENIVEEVGRIYGYDKIPPKLLDSKIDRTEEKIANKRYRLANKIREILVKQGFSEVYGYSFAPKGDIEVANPLALDRPFMRTNLSDWLEEKLAFNMQYVLFDTDPVKIFEIGRVAKKENGQIVETIQLALGVAGKAKKFNAEETVAKAITEVSDNLHVINLVEINKKSLPEIKGLVYEFSFEQIADDAKDLAEPNLAPFISPAKEYKRISAYPRVIRDVALWVPENIADDEVKQVIRESAGELLVEGPILFDRFPRDGKISLAFRQVFQSYDRTLSDEEVNKIMDQVIAALEEKGWDVRK